MKRIQDFSLRRKLPLLVFACGFLLLFLLFNLPGGSFQTATLPGADSSSPGTDTVMSTVSWVGSEVLTRVGEWMLTFL